VRAKLLTLMMILEVLAPEMSKHAAAIEMLQKLQADIGTRLEACEDKEEQFALESLLRELDFRKEKSIRRRVRELVRHGVGLQDADREQMESDVVDAYDLRGQLVHTGFADENAINKAHEVVLRATKALLRGRLGLQ